MVSLPLALGLALVAGITLFSAIFAVSRGLDNYAAVDIVWPLQFPGYAAVYAVLLEGTALRMLLFTALIAAWSLRLATHLYKRIRRDHPREDPRYSALRESWKPRFGPRMYLFFVFQGLAGWLLATPFVLPASNIDPAIGMWELLGIAVGLASVAGQASADRTLWRFKEVPSNRGQVCRNGLWAYSRHPNYFFEWLIWMAIATFAAGSPYGWLAFFSPVLMLYLLLKVTGVPPAEERALRTKGELYRNYRRTTNSFFPGPVRGPAEPNKTDTHE